MTIYQINPVLSQCNPFGTRILRMFSSEDDDRLSFEDFLDMLSVFSRAAPVTLKTSYAFRLYGGYLDEAAHGRWILTVTDGLRPCSNPLCKLENDAP